MINKGKTDKKLGEQVRDHLIKKGVETPMKANHLNDDSKKKTIEDSFTTIMETLGLDLADDSLIDTPKRVAKMFVNEVFYGLDYDHFPKCTVVSNKMGYEEMVIEKDITCISACEHHFVTIDGFCHIAYIPKKNVVGLSKMNRLVDFFAKRPQIQERLTEQIYHAMSFILDTEDVAVVVHGVHYCVKARGVRDTTSSTITSKMGGVFFTNKECRAEFLSLIK